MADPSRNINKTYPKDLEDGEISDDSSGAENTPKRDTNIQPHPSKSTLSSKTTSTKVSKVVSENEPIRYCICRSTRADTFMIGCDKCEEWYHGDCISITEEYSKKIEKFYCLLCRERDSSLQIVYKEKKGGRKLKAPQETVGPNKPLEELNIGDKKGYYGDTDYEPVVKRKKKKYIDSSEEEEFPSDDDADYKRPKISKPKAKPGRKPAKPAGRKAKLTDSKHYTSRQTDSGGRRNNRRTRTSLDHVSEGYKQCYGPGCIEVARKGSKYCSESCGLKLAENRIMEILPGRISMWHQNPSVSDDLSLKQLNKIHADQEAAKKKLEELEQRSLDLDQLIEKSKLTEGFQDEDEEEEYLSQEDDAADLSVYCVTCGHEVNNRSAMTHMKRCWMKHESQTSLGALFKTKIDNLFCDAYNPHQKTYCKRLRVLCPEHSKDPKIGDEEVCGYPLVTDVFTETGTFCRVFKKNCKRHHGWEKMRRALIDMERVQQWLRIDDLFEKEQRVRCALRNRGGLLGLLLHKTIPAPPELKPLHKT